MAGERGEYQFLSVLVLVLVERQLTILLQRVDPNRIYWMRNDGAPTTVDEEVAPPETGSQRREVSDSGRPRVHRPPSYASDDGVSYVVEAQPRSIAPTTDVPLGPHPAEAGRAARPPEW
jgi:hypothetical protein